LKKKHSLSTDAIKGGVNEYATPRGNSRVKVLRVLAILASLCLGLLLAISLFKFGQGSLHDLSQAVITFRPMGIFLITLSTLLHFFITAHKWRLAAAAWGQEMQFKGGYVFYTAIIALLGQFLPYQLAVTGGRALALRAHDNIPIRRGIASTIYDSFFDVLVPLLIFCSAPLYCTGVLSTAHALLMSITMLIFGGFMVSLAGKHFLPFTLALLARIPIIKQKLHGCAAAPDDTEFPNGAHSSLYFGRIYLWSTIRFMNLSFRCALIAWAAGIPVGLMPILYVGGVGVVSLLISITPGALGITEWGVAGILKASGLASTQAVSFALLARLSILTSVCISALIIATVTLVKWRIRNSKNPFSPRQ